MYSGLAFSQDKAAFGELLPFLLISEFGQGIQARKTLYYSGSQHVVSLNSFFSGTQIWIWKIPQSVFLTTLNYLMALEMTTSLVWVEYVETLHH